MPTARSVAPRPHTEVLFDDTRIDRRPGTLNKHSVLYGAELRLRAPTLYAFSGGEEVVPADRPSGFTAALQAREAQGAGR